MPKFPNYQILKAIEEFSKDKTRISQVDITLLLKRKFNITLTDNGYETFLRQTYSYIRTTKTHQEATIFKYKAGINLSLLKKYEL